MGVAKTAFDCVFKTFQFAATTIFQSSEQKNTLAGTPYHILLVLVIFWGKKCDFHFFGYFALFDIFQMQKHQMVSE